MITKIKEKGYKILLLFLALFIFLFIYKFFYDTQNIAEGELLEEIPSYNNNYTLKSFLINGGSLSADAVRVEIINNNNGKQRNIYFNYPENSVEIKWVDEETVEINGIILNIFRDTYDWRKNR